MLDWDRLAEEVVKGSRRQVEAATRPLIARLEALERRLDALAALDSENQKRAPAKRAAKKA